jgi:hypothetical protein
MRIRLSTTHASLRIAAFAKLPIDSAFFRGKQIPASTE